MSDLYVPLDGAGDSDLSPSTYSTLSGATVTAHNMQWRPRSAPKNISRAPSPFLGFWNRIGHHQHDDQLLRKTKDVDAYSNYTEKTYSVEGSVVDIHASHHDLATLPARSPSGTPNGSRDGKEPTGGAENVGPPPLTREEFEALPLAIQRKVRNFWLWVICLPFSIFYFVVFFRFGGGGGEGFPKHLGYALSGFSCFLFP